MLQRQLFYSLVYGSVGLFSPNFEIKIIEKSTICSVDYCSTVVTLAITLARQPGRNWRIRRITRSCLHFTLHGLLNYVNNLTLNVLISTETSIIDGICRLSQSQYATGSAKKHMNNADSICDLVLSSAFIFYRLSRF